MITCPRCNKEMEEGAVFCSTCGNKLTPEPLLFQNSDLLVSEELATEIPAQEVLTEQPVPEQPHSHRKSLKKVALFGGVGLLIAAVVAAVILMFPERVKDIGNELFSEKSESNENKLNYTLYLKDKEIFFSELSEESVAWQLTNMLIDDDDIEDSYDDYVSDIAWGLEYFTYISEDGSFVFYPEKVDLEDEGCNLYYRNIKDPTSDPVKIDANVKAYTVDSSTAYVTYLMGENDNLYQYVIDGDTKERIPNDVTDYYVSDDGQKIVYMDSDDNVYLKCAGQDGEKIASEVTQIVHVSEDLSAVFYTKNASLYKQIEGEDRIKLAEDIYSVVRVYDSGEVYYLKEDKEERTLMECVQDDMKDTDFAITMPILPSRPSWWDYDTTEAYNAAYAAYEEAYKAYSEDYQTYLKKVSRDDLREELEEATIELSSYTLCFCDGVEEKVLTETLEIYSWVTASDTPVITYVAYDRKDFEKVKLSEIASTDDVRNSINEGRSSAAERYVAIKGDATLIEQENATVFDINSSGTIIYYVDEIPEGEGHGILYKISLEDGVVGAPEAYEDDVCYYTNYFVTDDKFIYYKNVKDDYGDLYINKTRIDFDVVRYSYAYYEDLDKLIYFVDWDQNKKCGLLKSYQDGTAIKISDDVYSYSVTADGRILYLYDYSLDYHRGEMYEWRDGEKRKLDDDVSGIIVVDDDKYRGEFYYR